MLTNKNRDKFAQKGPRVHLGIRFRIPGGVGLQGPRGSSGRPKKYQGVKGYAYRILSGQRVGLQGPRASRGRPTGSQGVKG